MFFLDFVTDSGKKIFFKQDVPDFGIMASYLCSDE